MYVIMIGKTLIVTPNKRSFKSTKLKTDIAVDVNLASRKQELFYWVVLCSVPTVVPVVVWRVCTRT